MFARRVKCCNLSAAITTSPSSTIRHDPDGDGVSARYFKQVMLISEVNGHISELRSKGFEIESSTERDCYGFVSHRLGPSAPQQLSLIKNEGRHYSASPRPHRQPTSILHS
jgi:hypothetical protein